MDRAAYELLLAGQAAAGQLDGQRLDGLADAAVASGRITPARRGHWRALLAADPGAETILAGLSPGRVNLTESGHAGDATTGHDDVYRAMYPR